ncbi:MAG: HTH-type transcriptional regulator CysB [Psychromonas sp.]|nr:HTH-type transcriptional regulator CysB [Psychromonas sp.]
MKLQQLKYIIEIEKHHFNISLAADALFTSQPGVSKQIKLLEDELGCLLFLRSGRKLTGLTETGFKIMCYAKKILADVSNIYTISEEYTSPEKGQLNIVTSHTQSQYSLPCVIKRFNAKYPKISINIHQGTPLQISNTIRKGEADLAIATEALHLYKDVVMLPCYHWHRSIIVPKTHTLATTKTLTLHQLSLYPIVTYQFAFTEGSPLDITFSLSGLTPNVVFTATDADVIKTYVKQGAGVGLIASMAITKKDADSFHIIDVSTLFKPSTTCICIKKGTFLRLYMYEFIVLFAPHLTRDIIEKAMHLSDEHSLDKLFSCFTLEVK